MSGDSCCKKIIVLFVILSGLFVLPYAHAVDADDDKQDFGLDCNDNNYYIYNSAPQIPFDGIANDCRLSGQDGSLYDMNDPTPPSNGATYYLGDTIQLIGTDFYHDESYNIRILDADNRTTVISGKITNLYMNDTIYNGEIIADSEGNINVSVYLPLWHPAYGSQEPHSTGIWTVYIWFQAYEYAMPGYFEWIPFETFTVVEHEICDGIDNDLDGEIDEDFDEDNDGFTTCGGDCDDNDEDINPDADDSLCDGVDNNCNGETDEEYTPTPTSCGVGECRDNGQFVCVDGTLQNTCSPKSPGIEICDNLDNDCDKEVDENLYQNAGNFGVCENNTQTCESGAWIDNNEVVPTTEICDNLDNDCDGFIDENLVEVYGTSDIGICSLGTKTCIAGIWNITIPAVTPKDEICDGLDNDCDGFTDENNVCGLPDEDSDGVPDEFDLCEGTVPWFAEDRNKNHYDSENMYLTALYGCSCKQILDCKPGNNEGEYKAGCTQGTLDAWIDQDAWVKECKPKEPKKKETKSSKKKTEAQNETQNMTQNMTGEDNAFEYGIENKTDEYTNNMESGETGNQGIENNQSFTSEQDEKITTKRKVPFWDVQTILIQSIANLIRSFGIESLF